MATSIKASVGKSAQNNREDVMLVQTRLNAYVAANRLGARKVLAVDGNPAITIPYIEDFQRLVMGFNNPDGKIDVGKKTIGKLMEDMPDPFGVIKCNALALKNLLQGTVSDIPSDLWSAAMMSLMRHSIHPKLTRWNLITVVDFRKSNKTERLWTVDLSTRMQLFRTWVAHGGGMKNAEGHPIDRQGEIASRFEDGNRFSSLGAFVTLGTHSSNLGNLQGKPAMKLIGLEPGVNGRTLERGVLFHGADYVNQKPKGSVGNSWGCFATNPDVNPQLVNVIKGGSFVFAYHTSYRG
jgi:hypothetical protein